ncbi:MAG: hypothetical protein JJU46_14930 [Balneolaceae bacterium]|nr:hypothetical protein [Balneolaceae bacterium]MCH8549349.1 hypothetical protein [Balneolaceae bacterium]
MKYAFQQLKLTDAEKKWLAELAKSEFDEVDIDALKIKFKEEIRQGFDPDKIDNCLLQDSRLTLIGYWYLDEKHNMIKYATHTIEYIREEILQANRIQRVSASMVGEAINQDVRYGEIILKLLFELGGFFNTGAGPEYVKYGMKYAEFNKNGKAYDEFLKFSNIEEKMEDFFISRSNYNYSRGTTNWPKVDRQLSKAHQMLNNSQTEEEFQGVGLICREILISVAQEIYDEEVYPSDDGVTPSDTDAKRMFEAFLNQELSGKSNEQYRKLTKSAVQVADATQHKRTSDYLHAKLCLEGVVSVIEIMKVLKS